MQSLQKPVLVREILSTDLRTPSDTAFGIRALMLFLGLAAAEHPPADQLWQVKPAMNTNDLLFAGWHQIPIVKEIKVYNGVSAGRTYAHHPELFYLESKTYLIFSSAPVDEDSMGQDVRISVSGDGGLTWSANRVVMPAALLPNQTDTKNFEYWCSRNIIQRAWQALTFVHIRESDKLYAIGQGASVACPGDKQSAGRIAVLINKELGSAAGDPCWIEKNEYTGPQLFSQTVYGIKYGMKDCADAEKINAILREPDQAPAWSPWLYNHKGLFSFSCTSTVGRQYQPPMDLLMAPSLPIDYIAPSYNALVHFQ
ncbi:uncharacterized protein MYCFIDRAFT_177020 [Pseudocercospora fijiensis CIRAD86]|uniref:BT-1020-like N-terminal beta-propeller domain-containing protein n=1 Tax=Pseudocercospora fijiensis (strain CIRAD86) TaxID=383855 RepID=M3A5Y4_PSEFD|nr:uncharacterized protein MYCFIDRAFT_177020 [Pseudocercospora fijiensis CIRAD86]EME80031.1 hypothetical protein MYCFIDRAFT_177020 [Pseudocercospora fijiensis CIRAD86]